MARPKTTMKKLALVCAVAAGALLAGCASDYGHGRPGYNHYRASDVWYDGHYGAYNGGYWDGDSFFYTDRDGHAQRDSDGHFHHQRSDGFNPYQTTPHDH